MGFNYAKEKAEFDREWNKLRKEYRAAGMSESAIDALYEYDLNWFRSRRNFFLHTQSLPEPHISDEDEDQNSKLYRKFCEMSTSFDETDFYGSQAWLDSIADIQLIQKLKRLPAEYLELLTLIVDLEMTQQEIAALKGVSQAAISKKIKKIKEFLK